MTPDRAASDEGELAALRESERYYRDLFDATSDALFVHGLDGRILAVNRQMCALYGCTREEALASSVADLSSNEPPYTQAEADSSVQRTLNEGSCTFEWRSRKRSGELFWSEVALRRGELAGQPRVIACVRDISQRKQVEDALRDSEERFARIFNSSSNGMAFTGLDTGVILDVNDTWVRESGRSRVEVVGKTGLAVGLWARLEDREACVSTLRAKGRIRGFETVFSMREGQRHYEINAEVIELKGEKYVLWEFRDLTERRRAEKDQEKLWAQLLQAQKMESVGRLAGGVAHDFNNLLTVIIGYSDGLLEELAAGSQQRADVAEIRQAGDRAAALTQQLLAFSRQQILQPVVLDLNQVVTDTERLLRRLLGEDIEVAVDLDPALGKVKADASQINQILMNLAVNARDAMPAGGRLTIETENLDLDHALEAPQGTPPAGRYVRMSVSDSGAGMDRDTQAHLFEPFFTTKPRGAGTGLGLSTVYGIVNQSGGWIAVYSEVGVGSTFKVYLPRVDSQPPAAVEVVAAATGTGTILVVEDQADVRRITARMLRGLGYAVLEAGSGNEALAIAGSHPGRIDLLITDVVMPGMSGRTLGERIGAMRPDLRMLYVSGYTANVTLQHGVLDGPVAFLQKPFTAASIARKVRDVLAGPPPG